MSHDKATRYIGNELLVIVQRAKKVWKLIGRRQQASLVVATVIMAFAAWFNAHIPVTLGQLGTGMDAARKTGAQWGLSQASPLLISLCWYFLIREALQVLRKYLVHNTCTLVERDTEVGLVSHLLKVDISVLARDRVGALHGRIRRSIEGFVKLLHLAFMDLLPAILTAIFALGVAIHRQLVLGFAMSCIVPVAAAILIWQISSQKGIRIELLRSKESVDGTVVEQLSGIEYVRAANTEDDEARKVERVAEIVRKKEIKHHLVMSVFDCAKALNEGAFFILIIVLSILMAAKGRIASGDVITFAMLYMSVLTPLREIHRIVDEAHESALKVGDLLDMKAIPLDVSFSDRACEIPPLTSKFPVLDTRDLEVQYTGDNGTSRPSALKGITASISAGETIGVAGRTGCGKSTWIKALIGITHPSAGNIFIGDTPISRVSRKAIGHLVGYVGQNPFIFAGTIMDNIKYGCGEVSEDEVHRAAKQACIHSDIENMPDGYKTEITERGGNLSGGQRQRIALARVFLKNVPILILDEATSALDNVTEREVMNSINSSAIKRTTILVAHKLSTLKMADRILVFNNGKIAEVGDYDHLVMNNGVFAELVRSAGSSA